MTTPTHAYKACIHGYVLQRCKCPGPHLPPERVLPCPDGDREGVCYPSFRRGQVVEYLDPAANGERGVVTWTKEHDPLNEHPAFYRLDDPTPEEMPLAHIQLGGPGHTIDTSRPMDWRVVPVGEQTPRERVLAAMHGYDPPDEDSHVLVQEHETWEWQVMAAMLAPEHLAEVLDGDWPDRDELALIVVGSLDGEVERRVAERLEPIRTFIDAQLEALR